MGIEYHPYVHLALGELPYFILAKYSRGVVDRNRILADLKTGDCRNSCQVNHLCGDYDLGILAWVPTGELEKLLDHIRRSAPVNLAVFPLERISTCFQREEDVPETRPLEFNSVFVRDKGTHKEKWHFQESLRRERNVLPLSLKFYMVVKTRANSSYQVFDDLTRKLQENPGGRFFHATVCTFRTELEEGCIVGAYTKDWHVLQESLFELVSMRGPVQTSTYLCFDEPILEDEPWEISVEVVAGGLDTLAVRTLRAVTGVHAVRDESLARTILEALQGDDVRRSVLTYVPSYWWTYVRDIKTLIRSIEINDGQGVCRLLMLRYIEAERNLCNAVRDLFSLRQPKMNREYYNAELERMILNELGIVRFQASADQLREAKTIIETHEKLAKSEKKKLTNGLIGPVLKDYEELGHAEAHLMLGRIGDVVHKVVDKQLLRPAKRRYLEFRGNQLMKDWRKHLQLISADRNSLVHAEIVDACEVDADERPPWTRLLPNFIRGMPQVYQLLTELRRAHQERFEKHPVKLPLTHARPRAPRPSDPNPTKTEEDPPDSGTVAGLA